MKYQVAIMQDRTLYDCQTKFERKVNELCQEGWNHQGGISIATEAIGYGILYTLSQAMVKKEKNKEKEPECVVLVDDYE